MTIDAVSFKPYLARAVYEWICDRGYTPHILVNAEYVGVQVPRQYVKNGVIVLNIAPKAVNKFLFSNEALIFQARFSGITQRIHIPIGALQTIYAQENGEGKVFSEEKFSSIKNSLSSVFNTFAKEKIFQSKLSSKITETKASSGPHLKIVKNLNSKSNLSQKSDSE